MKRILIAVVIVAVVLVGYFYAYPRYKFWQQKKYDLQEMEKICQLSGQHAQWSSSGHGIYKVQGPICK